MTADKLNRIREQVFKNRPLIHCITNPISINQCANAVLSIGASPIMAEHPDEVEEITKTADALMLNLGNITDARIKAIMISASVAKENDIPFILDMVGVSCSSLRRKLAFEVIESAMPNVIKGNYSEINAFYDRSYSSLGVDAEKTLDEGYISRISVKLAREYNTIILASGKTDIITDGKKLIGVKNGVPGLSSVTGTGCMLGALCACYLSVQRSIQAAAAACAALGICGELSNKDKGAGSFMVGLMDNISRLSDEDFKNKLDMEEKDIENIGF